MFVDPSTLLLPRQQATNQVNETYAWVDGDALKKFLACDRSLDDRLRSSEPIVCPKSLLCPHDRLHPRVARRGKLLLKPLFDAYVALLEGERKLLCETGPAENESDVVGCVITPSENLLCDPCSGTYANELVTKLEFVRNVKALYFAVLDENAGFCFSAEDEYVYAVVKTSISKFRTLAEDLMKSVKTFDEGGVPAGSSVKDSVHLTFNGIDDIDISSFPNCSAPFGDAENSKSKTGSDDDELEELNRKITCKYVPHCYSSHLRLHAN
jgi:hypothetical protein